MKGTLVLYFLCLILLKPIPVVKQNFGPLYQVHDLEMLEHCEKRWLEARNFFAIFHTFTYSMLKIYKIENQPTLPYSVWHP
jgi:hypothetical protein